MWYKEYIYVEDTFKHLKMERESLKSIINKKVVCKRGFFFLGRESIVNKWNGVCWETTERKIEADLEILSVMAGSDRQNVGNKRVA